MLFIEKSTIIIIYSFFISLLYFFFKIQWFSVCFFFVLLLLLLLCIMYTIRHINLILRTFAVVQLFRCIWILNIEAKKPQFAFGKERGSVIRVICNLMSCISCCSYETFHVKRHTIKWKKSSFFHYFHY